MRILRCAQDQRQNSQLAKREFSFAKTSIRRISVMSNKGFSHIGLSTLDLDKTVEFYEAVLGFKTIRFDEIPWKRVDESATPSWMLAATR
jgi:Glyoxalase/Bleomycin resistance protein/Dioxygenase superfamily